VALIRPLALALSNKQPFTVKGEELGGIATLEHYRRHYEYVLKLWQQSIEATHRLEALKVPKRIARFRQLGVGLTCSIANLNRELAKMRWDHRVYHSSDELLADPEVKRSLENLDQWGDPRLTKPVVALA
jgi:hypothetical protein